MKNLTPKSDLPGAILRESVNTFANKHASKKANLFTKLEEKIDFIVQHFTFKECIKFVANQEISLKPGQIPRCYCGESEDNHFRTNVTVPPDVTQWSSKTHLKCFGPTNAFGRIEFLTETAPNQRPTEFIRISDEDKLEDVMTLMVNHWNMMQPRKPSLCISVIGGAKNFVLEGHKKEVFYSGLIQAARTTDAWIVTSGLNLGIIRVVGDALQEHQFSFYDSGKNSQQLRCLGIAPWGYVLNRQSLICDTHKHSIPYTVSTVIETGQPVSLNQNHTHYIFVDEGMRLRYGGSESARFRAKLEKRIALPQKNGGWGIPVVLVVVEGGHDVFIDARNSIREHVPVVICSGTGRAADILSMAFTYRQKHTEKEFTRFHADEEADLTRELTPVSGEKKVKDAIQMIIEIVRDVKLITTFDMNISDDLDLAILYALIKQSSDVVSQLRLAFAWDRSDIAEEKIFGPGARVDPKNLEPIAMEALLKDKPEFLRILLQNGVVMRQFLTLERLHILYNESTRRGGLIKCLIQNKLQLRSSEQQNKKKTKKILPTYNSPPTHESNQTNMHLQPVAAPGSVARSTNINHPRLHLCTVATLVKRMLGRFCSRVYQEDTPEAYANPSDWDRVKHIRFSTAFQELFLWAVLHQRQSMALYFWEHSDNALILALIACLLYSNMIKYLPAHDTETQALYESYIVEFETLAVRILEYCNEISPDVAMYLVECDNHLWGSFNCLQIAAESSRRKFISSAACQNSLHFAWCHGIRANMMIVLVTLFLPFLLKYDRVLLWEDKRMGIENANENKTVEEMNDDLAGLNQSNEHETHLNDALAVESSTSKAKQSFNERVKIFYTAPKTKFCLNAFAYIIFLLFFAYTLMFATMSDSITAHEAVIMAYFCAMVIDVIRQMCNFSHYRRNKLQAWWNSNEWGRLDLFAVLLAILSMFLRIGLADTFIVAKTCYVLTFIVCCIRVFRLYSYHPGLGPKLVMIERMMIELIVFIFLVLVVLISYGVSVQTLLYPNRKEFDWMSVRDVLYYPYFNLYGELSLDYSFAVKDGCNSTGDGITCPQYNFVTPLLLTCYLLIAGILLINLLIAIFSNVFQQVEDNSIELWKFNMFAMVVEYNKKPIVPVPLSVLQALIELVNYIIRKCSQRSDTARKTILKTKITESSGLGDVPEGARLFDFAERHKRRMSNYTMQSAAEVSDLSDTAASQYELSSSSQPEYDDDEMRNAKQLETHCKRYYLKKRKLDKGRTVDAGIAAIRECIEDIRGSLFVIGNQITKVVRSIDSKKAKTVAELPQQREEGKSEGRQISDHPSKPAVVVHQTPDKINISPLPSSSQMHKSYVPSMNTARRIDQIRPVEQTGQFSASSLEVKPVSRYLEGDNTEANVHVLLRIDHDDQNQEQTPMRPTP